MENRDKQNPSTGQESDLSKAQNQQQPQADQSQQQPQAGQPQQQPSSKADFGSAGQDAGQSDTMSQQRSDIEGGTATGQANDVEGGSSFVGSESASDTSSELIEDDDDSDFAKDGQGTTE